MVYERKFVQQYLVRHSVHEVNGLSSDVDYKSIFI